MNNTFRINIDFVLKGNKEKSNKTMKRTVLIRNGMAEYYRDKKIFE
jgi:hypothetical protein